MGAYVECPKCKQTYRYSSDEIDNVGSIARLIFSVVCKNCSTTIKGKETPNFPKNKDLNLDYNNEGMVVSHPKNTLKQNPKGDAHKRVHDGTILEYWVQKFFQENYKDYGFSKVEGPFDSGPDFTTTEKGEKIGIEIEINCRNYKDHKHHLNEKFSIVKYLIVLKKSNPSKELQKLLPKKIIFVNEDIFVPWFRIKCKEYSEGKTKERKDKLFGILLNFIAGEFLRRYVKICPDTERDMAICPDCANCAYRPEIDFQKWAIDFIIKYDYPLQDEEFSLSEIAPKYIDDFFIKILKAYRKGL
jgi:hypothetical protein